MRKAFGAFDRLVSWLEDLGCILTFAVIVGIVSTNVFYRYVLVRGILWSDELVQILLVFMVMFGSARAIRTNGHTELNSFANRLPVKARTVVRAAICVVCIAFFLIFLFSALDHTLSAGRLKTVILRLPRAYCYAALPMGAILMLYEFLKTIKHRVTHDPREDEIRVERGGDAEGAR